jgi:hypothetical protein
MTVMLIVLAAITIVSNLYEVRVVQKHIEAARELDLTPFWKGVESSGNLDSFAFARWRTIAALENQAMENRYHQASAIVMSRLYLIFLGFATGVMLALVGATFILGKLNEAESHIVGEGAGWRVSLQTASPGLVLATLGTVLIVWTIWARAEVNLTDSALYLPARTFEMAPATPLNNSNENSLVRDPNAAIRQKIIKGGQPSDSSLRQQVPR